MQLQNALAFTRFSTFLPSSKIKREEETDERGGNIPFFTNGKAKKDILEKEAVGRWHWREKKY